MGIRVGMPMMKLSRGAKQTKRKGDAQKIAFEALEERYSKDKDLDRSRSHLNEYAGFRSGADLYKYWTAEADAHLDAKGRKLRSDAVVGYALIVKPDMTSMQSMTENERIAFVKDGMQVAAEILHEHGLQVDATALHRDELNEHGHILGHDADYRAGKKIDIRLFRDFNTEFPKRMRELGYDVEDMSVYDVDKVTSMTADERESYKSDIIRHKTQKQNGRSSSQYKSEKIAEQEKALAERAQQLQDAENALRASQTAFERQKQNYIADVEKERKRALERVRSEVQTERDKLMRQAQADAVNEMRSLIADAKKLKVSADIAKSDYENAVAMFRDEGRENVIQAVIDDLNKYQVQGNVKGSWKPVRAGSWFNKIIRQTITEFGNMHDNSSAVSAEQSMRTYDNLFDTVMSKVDSQKDDDLSL